MADLFSAKKVYVPGLTDGGIDAQLEILKRQNSDVQKVSLPPNSAYERADEIIMDATELQLPDSMDAPPVLQKGDRLAAQFATRAAEDAPAATTLTGAVKTALDYNPLFPGLNTALEAVNQAGTLTERESFDATQQNIDDAKALDKTLQEDMKARQAMRQQRLLMSDEEARTAGFPPVPRQQVLISAGQEMLADIDQMKASQERIKQAEENIVTQSAWLNGAQVALKSAARVGTSAVAGVGALAETARNYSGLDLLTGDGRSWLREGADIMDASLDQMLPGDKAQSKTLASEIMSAGGSFLGYMVAGYVTRAAGVGSTTSISALGGAGEGFREAERFGATEMQQTIQLILRAGIGATEAIPIDRMLFRANVATGGLGERLLRNTKFGSLEEFIQEFSQAAGEDIVAKYGIGFGTGIDPERELDPGKWLKQGAIGGLVGGAGGAAATLIGPGEPGYTTQQQELMVTQAVNLMQTRLDEILPTDMDGTTPVAIEPGMTLEPIDTRTPAQEVQPGAELEPVDISTEIVESVDRPEPPPQDASQTVLPDAAPPVETGGTVSPVDASTEVVEAKVSEPVKAAGGTMPAPRADGKIELTHWARAPRPVLDPVKMGTGPFRGQERARLVGPEAVPRTYYGVNAGIEMSPEASAAMAADLAAVRKLPKRQRQDAEREVWRIHQRRGGYIREAENMGNARHTVAVDPNRLYNLYEDPLGLKAGIDRSLAPSEQLTQYERIIRDAGWAGYYVDEGPQGQTVALFEAATPESVIDERTGENLMPDPAEDDFEARTGTSMFGDEEIKARIKPTGKRGQATVKDVAAAMDEDHAANHGRKFFPETDEADFQVVREIAVDELRAQLDRPNSGVGWYTKDTADAVALTARVFPTLATNPEHRDLFLTYAGIFSNGTDPVQAWQMAAEAFRYYLATGQLPVARVKPDGTPVKMTTFKSEKTGEMVTKPTSWGIRGSANETLLTFTNYLIEREGSIGAAMEWLRSPQPRTEINRAMTESGAFKEGRYKTKASQKGETYGALAFGEKLGRYTLGLHGVPVTAEDTTVDLWYTRTFRRWTGRMTDGELDGVVSEKERQAIFGLTDELVREFGLTAGDVQAALWFFEKRLWGELGVKTDEGTNSSGARKLIRTVLGEEAVDVDDGAAGDGQGDSPDPEAEYEAAVVGQPDLTRLPGLPKSSTGPIESVVRAARAYADSIGIPVRRQKEYVKADPERGKRIAQAYEEMQHNPEDPAVKAAFQAMIDETLAQYQFVKASGLQIEAIEDGVDPYPEGPKQVLEDLQNGHLWFFPTESGFGTLSEAEQTNPLLAPTNEFIGDRQLLANDVFRIVHDFFGHGMEGAGFGATGEENAWQSHMRLYTEAALPAVTSETRGQNSWVNFGPYGEANRANQRETVYADQKTGLMPSWTWTEGVADDAEFEAARAAEVEAAVGTGGARNPYKAEQTRDPAGTPTTPQNAGAGDDGNLVKISRNFIKTMNLIARQGRFTLKGSNVMGQYSAKQGTVRLRSWSDLSTLVHEGGHALHDAMAGPLKAFVSRWEPEVIKVGHDLYGDPDIVNEPKAKQIREGFAEFVRVYTLNRPYAAAKYPGLTADFTTLLQSQAPQVETALDITGQQFHAYLMAPSVEVMRNNMVPGIKPSGFAASLKALKGTLPEGVEARGLAGSLQELKDRGFTTWFHEVNLKVMEGAFNRYVSLRDLEKDLLNLAQKNRGQSVDMKRAESPYTLARLAPNFGSRAFIQMIDGIMPYRSTTPASPSLRDALLISQNFQPGDSPSKWDEALALDFDTYLASLRIIDEYRRYAQEKIARPPVRETLGDAQQAAKELLAANPQFAKAAQMVHDFSMAMWQKQFDAGLMDKETYQEGLDHQFYVPLQRDRSDKQSVYPGSSLTGARRLVQRFKGSDRRIISPTAVLMDKMHSLEKAIAENDVKLALAQLAEKAGQAGALVERIPATQMIGQNLSVKDIGRKLAGDPTLSPIEASDLLTILSGFTKDATITMFRSEEAGTGGEPIVFYFDKGKIAALQIKDGQIGTDVVNLLNGLGRENMPLGMELIAGTSQVYRSAITSWPDFLIVNFVRDQVSTWILNSVGFKPFVTGFRGMAEEVRQRTWARSYNASMGVMGGMNVAALHRSRLNRDIDSLRADGYLHRAFGEQGFSGALKGFARLMELSETGTRVGLYKLAYERGKADGLTDYEASVEAAYMATDTMDFGLNGNKMLFARRTIPFLNAQFQGLYKMMRTLGADEVRQRKGLKFVLKAYFKSTKGMDLSRTEKLAVQTGRAAWAKMVGIGMFSALLHFIFEDDEAYQDAGDYLRSTNWVIPVGDDQIITIPKPFELAIVANAIERGLESASGDPTAKYRFLRGAAMSLLPPMSPPAIQTLVELQANYDFFRGSEITPDYMRALDPVLRYDAYTSSLAKSLGETMGWSPLVVDHVLSGLGASAYRDVSNMTNMMDPDKPTLPWTDMPVMRRFFRDSRRGSRTADDFWKQANQLDGKLRSAEVTYKRYLEMGNEPAANRFLQDITEEEASYAILTTHFKSDAKKLNPWYRGAQVGKLISGMNRELITDLGLENTDKYADEPSYKMTRKEKAKVRDLLVEIGNREMRNTMVSTGAPGWEGRAFAPVEPTMKMLEYVSPRAYEELIRRLNKAKVYDAQAVFDGWPEVRNRLLTDREGAYLDDMISGAKAYR